MRQKRHFTKEFKQEAVNLSYQEGVKICKVAVGLGIDPNILSRWRREFKKEGHVAFPGTGHQSPEQQRISELEKKLKRVKAERDILKKAMGIFATE